MDSSCVEGESLADAIHLMQARLDAFQNLASSKSEATKRTTLKATTRALSLFQQRFAEAGFVNMGATAGVEKLSQDLGQLAASVVEGTTVLDDITKDALMEIWQHMEDVFVAAQVGHENDQKAVLRAKKAIGVCTKHTTGFGVFKNHTETARNHHNTCRSAEVAFLDTKDEHCGNLESHVTTPDAPACMAGFSKLDEYNLILKCVVLIAAWAPVYHAELIEDKVLCDSATTDHRKKKSQCGDDQGRFEDSFCSYREELMSKCGHGGSYQNCRTAAISDRNDTHVDVKETERSRQAEYASAKHIQCFLTVLNMTLADDQERQLDFCKGLDINLALLEINYPDIPDEVVCDVDPVSLFPCVDGWVIEEYTNKSWYALANTKNCTPCE